MKALKGRKNARIGWLATTFALAIALVIGSWLNYRGAVAAVATLNRGQADLLEIAIREVVHPGAALDSAALSTFLETHAGTGLRYVALLSPDGSITASAGVPATQPSLPPRDSLPGDDSALVDLGERVRAYFPRPPIQGEPGGERFDRRPDGLSPSSRAEVPGVIYRERREPTVGEQALRQADRTSMRPPYHLLEFEPVVASGIVTRAARSLVLAGVAATILTLAALAFWRTSEQYEAAQFRLEEQRRLTQLGEMSAVLAHEIRNPLASLKGNAQLLAERLPADSREYTRAERVVAEATRLEALTSDLLDFARAGPVETRPADPVQVLHTAITDVDPVGFDVDVEDAPAAWPMDVARMRQALVNVLQNARQAAPDGGLPRVRVAQERDALVFEVRDRGPGLPPGNENRIFEPFFTTRTNGTGLGLAVARRVAEMHGGGISARNHPDGGAVFRIVMPPAAG